MVRISEQKGDTWPKVLKYNYERYGDSRRAMRHKHYGIWQPHSWKDYYLNVKYLALGLLALGFEAGDKLLIVGDNAPQWYYAELAAQANHGVAVGLFSELRPPEIQSLAKNSEARFAVVESQEQVDKFIRIKDALPDLRKVIFWNYKGLVHYDDPLLAGYRQVLQLGREYERERPGHFEQNVASARADDVCAIVYTAGTTAAAPKGAVHTHRSMMTTAERLLQLDRWNQNDNEVPYLPPVWMSGQWFGIGCHLLSASTLNFAEAPETQQRDSKETEPSIVCYGARMWETQAAMVQARIMGADAVKRFVFRLLMPFGEKAAERKYRRQKPGIAGKLLYAVADVLLLRSIKRSLGLSNARICYSTGAILSPEALRFYHALGLPLKNLYGTTEGGMLTGARHDDIRLENLGHPHDGAEVNISPAGELIYRQPGMFVEYYRDPQLTAAVLKDGWFHSGDGAAIGEDGHLVFLDRIRSLVRLHNGDTLAPQHLESRLRSSPFIKDAWVLADAPGGCVAAIIVINYDTVGKWAGQRRVGFATFTELSQAPEVYGLVRQDIERVNRRLPAAARVNKFVNLHREFDPDRSELTRTRNLRREILQERFRPLVEAIFGDRPEAVLDPRVGQPEGRTATLKTMLRIQSIEGAG